PRSLSYPLAGRCSWSVSLDPFPAWIDRVRGIACGPPARSNRVIPTSRITTPWSPPLPGNPRPNPPGSLPMRTAVNFTRRNFLEVAAAGSIAMPGIVPASVFGADGKAPPSERITVGFIGCGKMANDYHLPELLKAGDVQSLAVCEVDTKRREHAKKR